MLLSPSLHLPGMVLSIQHIWGGTASDYGYRIAIDNNGFAYVTGYTYSTDFPVSSAYQDTLKGDRDAFFSILSPAGNVLEVSTFLGGSYRDYGYGIAIDADRNVYLAGQTQSDDFPIKNAFQNTYATESDGFVVKLIVTREATLETLAVTEKGTTNATGNGDITSLGVGRPTAHGVCWSLTTNPTTANNHTDEGVPNSTGTFTSTITGLSLETTYYVRAYATNIEGTSYGEEVSFTTLSSAIYTITASVESGGSIDPQGEIVVNGRTEKIFTIVPDTNYTIGPVQGTCDGTLNTGNQTFVTNQISQDCTVVATFVPDTSHHSVTSSSGTGGSISPLGEQNVADGGIITFYITPDADSAIGPIGGTCTGTLNTQTQTFTTDAVTLNCTVEGSFVDATDTTYATSTSVTGKGRIEPATHPEVAAGGVVSFSLHPAPYNSIASVSGCDGTRSGKYYLTGAVNAPCKVEASFDRTLYKLTVTKTGKGWNKGTVTTNLQPDLNCFEKDCTGIYKGTVTLSATPPDKVTSWTGCSSVSANTCTVK
jgi:hypothetical protein